MRSHETFLNECERALGTHSWDAIAPLIEDDACFVFSDGTYFGMAEIERAIRKTFDNIQDETCAISNVRWQYVRDDAALCVYTFKWARLIDDKASAGSGRGTTFLTRQSVTWKIKHEHLGPPAQAAIQRASQLARSGLADLPRLPR